MRVEDVKVEELTVRFPNKIKPVRPGVYLVTDHDNFSVFRYFDGEHWYYGNADTEKALKSVWGIDMSYSRPFTWQGVNHENS